MDILKKDICNLPGCNCGWNITIGGISKKQFEQIQKYVKRHEKEC